MLHSIEMGWYLLNKYYSATDDVPAYAAALLLDPQKRQQYLDKNWPESWHSKAVESARQIWKREYDCEAIQPLSNSDNVSLPALAVPSQFQQLLQSIQVQTTIPANEDTFDAFISLPAIRVDCTALKWWCRIEQRQRYPRLSRMAIDILSIPPQSAEPERTFSGARRTASWDRLSMSSNSLEMVECVGNWLRQGHVERMIVEIPDDEMDLDDNRDE